MYLHGKNPLSNEVEKSERAFFNKGGTAEKDLRPLAGAEFYFLRKD